jgi:hypothetical protein
MRILFPEMHNSLTPSLVRAVDTFGATLLLPDASFAGVIRYGTKYTEAAVRARFHHNAHAVSYAEVMDSPPEVIFISCLENASDVLQNIWNRIDRRRSKLCAYNGNNIANYDFKIVRNVLSTDAIIAEQARRAGGHSLYYFPWVDYEAFAYGGPSDRPVFRSYINQFSQLFPEGYALAQQCAVATPEVRFEYIEGRKKTETPSLMHESMATIHAKPLEGFGFAIVESLASGRPVILYRPWSANRSYTQWCRDGTSAIYFSDEAEYRFKISRFLSDADYRHALQAQAAETVRRVINNEEQSAKLKKFMEELI